MALLYQNRNHHHLQNMENNLQCMDGLHFFLI
nr:CPPV093 hypothetical protein [Cooks petrelpox virus]